jgi:hypothetical protein
MQVSGQLHARVALPSGDKTLGTHYTAALLQPGDGLDFSLRRRETCVLAGNRTLIPPSSVYLSHYTD